MTDSQEPALQFERAEFAAGAPASAACAACQTPIRDAYYMVNGAVACERCRRQAEFDRNSGSGFARFVKATVFGVLAGAVGAGLWYGVRALTGYEVGLISIVVGLLVGNAVLKGSGGRGGRGYQVLAVVLTYGAIASTYVPMITKELFQRVEQEEKKEGGAAAAPAGQPAAQPAAPNAPAAQPAPSGAQAVTPPAPPGAGGMLVALAVFTVVVGGIALVAPFLGGFENIIGILIIAFGVWEAWKINRKTTLEITGPHKLAHPAADVA